METAVQIVERQILAKLRHQRFFSLAELNQAISQQLRILNTKPFQLDRAGIKVGRRRVGTLMKRMGIEALYRKPGTSKQHPGHKNIPISCAG